MSGVYLGKEYTESSDARVIDMAADYRLQYNEAVDTYYCLHGAQTRKSLNNIAFNINTNCFVLVEERIIYLQQNEQAKPQIPAPAADNSNPSNQGQGQQAAANNEAKTPA